MKCIVGDSEPLLQEVSLPGYQQQQTTRRTNDQVSVCPSVLPFQPKKNYQVGIWMEKKRRGKKKGIAADSSAFRRRVKTAAVTRTTLTRSHFDRVSS